MRLTPYGQRELAWLTIIAGAVCAALTVTAWLASPWALVALPAPLAVGAWGVWFFRDPPRRPPDGEDLVVSAADGRVADITPVGADGPLGESGVRVGVFMSIFNVHVNRAPLDARVTRIVHHPGRFFDARSPEALERNESVAIGMACGFGDGERTVLVRQVAGKVARRIVTDLAEGQAVTRGQRIGMIKFGSRLEVYLPASLSPDVRVAVGQRVTAGESVLARLQPDRPQETAP